jgi:hypothetical protein
LQQQPAVTIVNNIRKFRLEDDFKFLVVYSAWFARSRLVTIVVGAARRPQGHVEH